MLWYPMVNHYFPPTPLPPTTNTLVRASNAVDRAGSVRGTNGVSNTVATIGATAPASSPAAAFPSAVAARMPEASEQLLVFENDKGRYTFTSHGGGIKQAELKSFPELVGSQRKLGAVNTNSIALNKNAPLPIAALIGNEVVWGDGIYLLTKTADSVRAEKKMTNGLVIVKEFRFKTNYLIETSVRYENGSKQPATIPAHQYVVGTSTRSIAMIIIQPYWGRSPITGTRPILSPIPGSPTTPWAAGYYPMHPEKSMFRARISYGALFIISSLP